jgi:hypothetical protein
MDPATVKDVEYYLAHYWSLLAVSVIVYLGGIAVSRVLRIWVPAGTPESQQPIWFRLWDSTKDWHPIGVGGLLGLIPFPTPEFITLWYVRVLWFAGVGAISGQIYRAATKTIALVPDIVRSKFASSSNGSKSPSTPPEDPGALPPDAGGGS